MEQNVSQDHCDTSVTLDVPSSSSSSMIPAAEASNTVASSIEALAGVPFSLQSSVASSASSALCLESLDSSPANLTSFPTTVVIEEVPVLFPKLLQASESSPDLRQCSEESSANNDDQKWADHSFRNCRNTSSSSLTDMSDNRRFKTSSKKRKRRHEDDEVVPERRELTLDKVPNYYTALSIPVRVLAGSAPRSSSDLIADFLHNERDPSPERKTCSTYDKLPAYYSSFTNSTRYDDHDYASLPEFEANFCQDGVQNEERYRRSCDDSYEQRSADELPVEESGSGDDSDAENGTNTENVSHFVLKKKYTVIVLVVLLLQMNDKGQNLAMNMPIK